MTSIAIACVLGLAPVPVIYLFYRRYFLLKHDFTDHLEYFAVGVLLAPMVVLASPSLVSFIPANDPVMEGFFRIAAVEKAGAFAAILALMIRSGKRLTVIDAVVSSMLLGLGFATVENVLFAVTSTTSVLLVRFMSSVPLHALSCGLIGYFLAAMMLSASLPRRAVYFLAAMVLPVVFHGLYDSLLLIGGTMTYWLSALLVLLIAVMEYLLAKSQVLPSAGELGKERISLEDWNTIQQQPRFERWIVRSMGARNTERVAFFRYTLTRVKLCVIVVIAAMAVVWIISRGSITVGLHINLTRNEATMIFVLIPLLYCFNLLALLA